MPVNDQSVIREAWDEGIDLKQLELMAHACGINLSEGRANGTCSLVSADVRVPKAYCDSLPRVCLYHCQCALGKARQRRMVLALPVVYHQ